MNVPNLPIHYLSIKLCNIPFGALPSSSDPCWAGGETESKDQPSD